ncbi:hypothetical protein [Streptomyces pini]|uniref:Uncharacterized protein n=1 Tax=Streptomyces pini TaxID=1520580 RepID=A0A1I3XL25_9ACTN|nr:hypothetical protein [Streptomyces pini]SFK20253.1 hypothetical protein SAMN05192584_104227 [Streptomyces pini]
MTANSPYEQPSGHGPQSSQEARVQALETQVQALAEAVRALARGLEQPPSQDTVLPKEAARGARLAHEILLAQGL